jgi:acetoin utilization deacetylase AcuC-like enzyme
VIVYFHRNFYRVYTQDPAAAAGRMEAVVEAVAPHVEMRSFQPATTADIETAHTARHIERVRRQGVYDIAALAAGGAIQAAETGMEEPSFALVRPPGHHASADGSWGFCFFNNLALSLYRLRSKKRVQKAFVLDFDLHFGDGNVSILGSETWVDILNPRPRERRAYLEEVGEALEGSSADVFAVSAGFDNHVRDWGGLLETEDYRTMGARLREAAVRNGGGCYGILEGGYNHGVLGENVLAFLQGMDAGM